jgi:competence protein ComEA
MAGGASRIILDPALQERHADDARRIHPPTKGKHNMKYMLTLIAIALLAIGFVDGRALAAEPVNVNTATAEEIAENLKGVGLSKAKLIIAYREANGSFLHADELVNVKGIGIRTIDQNRDMILVGNEGRAAGE